MPPKTILVTGASRGIGLAIARKALREACRVILVANDEADLRKAAAQLAEEGADPAHIAVATLDLGDAAALAARVPELPWLHDSGLDGLVNNAAIEVLHRFEDYPPGEIERTFRVNCLGPLVLTQLCLPALKRRKGSIVNLGSVADRRPAPLYSVYAASKAFLHAASKNMAKELGFDGIRVNVVSPGGVQTPLMDEIVARHFSAEHVKQTHATIPIEQRWAFPEEIAEAVWFALTGPRYFSGADLQIDGAY